MSDLKDNLQIQVQDATVRLEEAGFSFGRTLQLWPVWKRKIFFALLIALIPTFLVVRYGTELVLSYQYRQTELTAHPAFNLPSEPKISTVNIVAMPNSQYGAYVEIENPNLELAADNIRYTFTFQNSLGSDIASINATTYLLPNEKKFLVVPRIDSSDIVRSGKISLEEIKWQRKLNLPEVTLRTNDPAIFEEINPLTFVAEGSVLNSSPYSLNSVKLVFFVYDKNNRIIAISQRDEFNIAPFARRAYKQLWPNLSASNVGRVQVYGYTNLLDPDNVLYTETGSGIPTDRPSNSGFF